MNREFKGKRCLTHIHVKSLQEAAAAEEAGVDLQEGRTEGWPSDPYIEIARFMD